MNFWWRRRTLRFRLALWYGVGGTVLLAAFSATLYLYVSSNMAAPLDEGLRQDLAEILRRLKVEPDHRVFWDGSLVRGAAWNPEDPWFELWDEHGVLVRRLWPFRGRLEHLPMAPVPNRETLSIFNVARDIRLRVLSVPYSSPGIPEGWMIRVMSVHQPAAGPLGPLQVIIVTALPVVVALLVLGGFVVTRRWLMPLDEMVNEANRITADDLSRRLPVVNPHDELGRLATVFNVTLDRLQDSFVTLDRFVADASHELRTPLTTLRSVGEVGLRRGRSVEEYRDIIASMLEESQRLQLLIERLLELASAEGGVSVVQPARIQLDEFVTTCVSELGILAENRGQHLTLETVACATETDPVILRQALQNLVDNALKYSPDGATIRVSVRATDTACAVSVTDEGPGISPEHRARLTERFFRSDSSRDRRKGGFGLGLSITKAYMRVLGGTLAYEAAQPKGSTFRLTLPKA